MIGSRKKRAEHLQERVQVLVLRPDVEYARAAVAEERLEDDVAVPATEIDDHVALGGDQCRRHQFGKAGDEEFLRRVPHMDRVVDHQRVCLDVLQNVGGGDVGHVEGRVLAHQHDVHAGEIDGLRRAEGEVIAGFPTNLEGTHRRLRSGRRQREVLRQVVVQPMAPGLRFQREHEGAVGFDVDGLDRVHLNGHGEAHVMVPLRPSKLSADWSTASQAPPRRVTARPRAAGRQGSAPAPRPRP